MPDMVGNITVKVFVVARVRRKKERKKEDFRVKPSNGLLKLKLGVRPMKEMSLMKNNLFCSSNPLPVEVEKDFFA